MQLSKTRTFIFRASFGTHLLEMDDQNLKTINKQKIWRNFFSLHCLDNSGMALTPTQPAAIPPLHFVSSLTVHLMLCFGILFSRQVFFMMAIIIKVLKDKQVNLPWVW